MSSCKSDCGCNKNWLCKFLQSSIGKKFVLGLTGLMLAGFVLTHMAGNMLIIFKGAEAYNYYGHSITSNPLYPLISWGLVGIFIVHILTALLITKENKAARPQKYLGGETKGEKAVSVASRTMIYSGALIAAFLVSHLMTFKYGTYYTVNYNGIEMRDLAKLLFEVFKSPLYVFWYVVSLALLALHLKHGVAAAFQTIGMGHPRYTQLVKCMAVFYAAVVSLGFISQPLYVLFLK